MVHYYFFSDGWALITKKALRSVAKYERNHGALVAHHKVAE